MTAALALILKIVLATWAILRDAAPYMLGGFLLAGVVRAFIPTAAIVKLLGKPKFSSVLWAAAIGVPLPLCSCGVVPMAAALRRAGASKGAVSSFVISTPETGVDSIAATYALMDVPMTVIRPVVAFVTAFLAGAAENLLGVPAPPVAARAAAAPQEETCAYGCAEEAKEEKEERCGCGCEEEGEDEEEPRGGVGPRVAFGVRYAFGEMFEDMAPYLLVGFAAAGILAAAVPPTLIAERLASPILQVVAMVILGTPIYVCATAATPIAAVLIAKGVTPGAALAFLLAGPATNAASIAVLTKYLGRRSVVIYLVTIVVVAVAAGIAVNALYDGFGWPPAAKVGAAETAGRVDYVGTITAAAFLLLCVNGLRRKWWRKRRKQGRIVRGALE